MSAVVAALPAATTDGAPLPAPPSRSGTTIVGTLFVIAAGTMLFGGLLGSYLAARDAVESAGGTWGPVDLAIPNTALAVAYLTLGMSSVTAQWAVAAIAGDDRRNAYVAIGLTLFLGVAYVNALAFSFTQLGLVAGEDTFANHVYAVTVTHLLAVFAAFALWIVLAFRVFGGQLSARDREPINAAATFWHFVVLAGGAVWYVVWFLEGGPTS